MPTGKGSSSLRNAVKRITHKERSQPQNRSHLGLLQKHGDYKKRAVHYHKQEDRLQNLQRKANMRNPDEFYFGMTKAQVLEGKGHQTTQAARSDELAETIGPDAVRVMKSQDLAYVRQQKQIDQRKAMRLKESLHLIGASSSSQNNKAKHTIFVQSQQEAQTFDPAKHFDTAPQLMDRAFNRPRTATLRKQAGLFKDEDDDSEEASHLTKEDLKRAQKQQRAVTRKAAKARSLAYAEFEARTKRARAMERAEAQLVTEKLVSGKGRKRKIKAKTNNDEGVQPAQYKWRRKRNK